MIGKLITMAFVACDPRINPAARLVGQCASAAFESTAKLVDSLCSSDEYEGGYAQQSDAASRAPVARPQATQVSHCAIPDYTARISAVAEGLSRAYHDQLSAIACTRREIDSHERIDLSKLDGEIRGVTDEISACQSSQDALGRQRQTYRAEGMLRNVFAHGFSQMSLAHRMSKLRNKRAMLVLKRAELEALVAKRKAFDFAAQRAQLKGQEQKLAEIARDYNAQKARIDDFAQQMKGCVDRISDAARLLNSEIDRYNILSQYAAELDAAYSSYDRMRVHRKCEETFGDGAVGKLRGQSRTRIYKLSDRYNEQLRLANRRAREIGLLA